jgi:hypothetical protein
MEGKKQTGVEFLIQELTKQNMYMHLFEKEIAQAKEMEKEQIIMAYKADLHPCSDEDAEQYYNETYGKDKSED